jgi:FKBP-type peptidyl-prolyl cis-trans isomerase SlpA
MNPPVLATVPPEPAGAEPVAVAEDPARVQPGSFLTLHYRLIGPDGQDVVSSFGGAPATLSLGSGQLAPAIEQRLLGLAEGERARFELPPGAAYGERNPALVQRVRRALLLELGDADTEYHVGDVVQFPPPASQPGGAPVAGVLREIGPADEGWLLFDFNHPLAGQALGFEVHVLGVL